MPFMLSGAQVVVDLTTRDFEGFRRDALELAPTLTPYWTDFSPLEPAVVLVEQFAIMSDVNSYYIDRNGNEAFLSTCVLRSSAVKHAALVGYNPSAPAPASVVLTITTDAGGTILAGQHAATSPTDGSSPLRFEVYEDTVIPGAGTYQINAAHLTLEEGAVVASSTGAPKQKHRLPQNPLVTHPDSGNLFLKVFVDEGGGAAEWTLVDNFVDSEPTDLHYRVYFDESDTAIVEFGDGVNGKIPAVGSSNITADFAYGGGIAGNSVGKGTITDTAGLPTFVQTVTNAEQPSGGADIEGIDSIKENAPRQSRANDRAVSFPDYESFALTVGGINRARASRGKNRYQVHVVVAAESSNPVPTGSWDSFAGTGSGLLGAVGTLLESKKAGPVEIKVTGPNVVEAWYEMNVICHDKHYQAQCKKAVNAAIANFLAPETRALGEDADLSSLYQTLKALPQVRKIDVLRFARWPYLRQLGASSGLTLDAFDFGENPPTFREAGDRFTLTVLTATTYSVRAVGRGYLGEGTFGEAFTTPDGEFTFTVSAAANAVRGSKYEMVVSSEADNIKADDDELIVPPGDASRGIINVTGGFRS